MENIGIQKGNDSPINLKIEFEGLPGKDKMRKYKSGVNIFNKK